MKRLMIGLIGALAFAAAAQAAEAPAQDTVATQATAQDAVPGNAQETPQVAPDEASKNAMRERNCLRHTGSRIHQRSNGKGGCTGYAGSSYSRDDIDRTGEVDLADALRKLDPSIH